MQITESTQENNSEDDVIQENIISNANESQTRTSGQIQYWQYCFLHLFLSDSFFIENIILKKSKTIQNSFQIISHFFQFFFPEKMNYFFQHVQICPKLSNIFWI